MSYATRLYLTNSAPAYVPDTARGAWDNAVAGIDNASRASKTKAGVAGTYAAAVGSTTGDWDVLVCRFISDPLTANCAFSPADGVEWAIGVRETNAGLNAYFHVHIFVTVGDTDALRGTILSDYIDSQEWPTTATGRAAVPAPALAAASALVGDRIVIEIGFRANSSSVSYVGRVSYGTTGTPDLTDGDTNVTTRPGWVQLSTAQDPFGAGMTHEGAAALAAGAAAAAVGAFVHKAAAALACAAGIAASGTVPLEGGASLAAGAAVSAEGFVPAQGRALLGAGASLSAAGAVQLRHLGQLDHAPLMLALGLPASAGGRSTRGFVDNPEADVLAGAGSRSQGRDITLTVLTGSLGPVERDDPVTVDGLPFVVRSARQSGDGGTTVLELAGDGSALGHYRPADFRPMLATMGYPVSANGRAALGFVDDPDAETLPGRSSTSTGRNVVVTVLAGDLSVAPGDAIVVDGNAYTVREVRDAGDGALREIACARAGG